MVGRVFWGVLFVGVAAALLEVVAAEGHQSEHVRDGRTIVDSAGIVKKFHEGFEMAGKFLGLDTSQGVANLVSASFVNTRPSWLRNNDSGMFTGFFRLMGFDATKLGAIALNALIFIAQMISTSFSSLNPANRNPQEKVDPPKESPMTWILNNPSRQVATLLSQAQEQSLPDLVIDSIAERSASANSNTECVQLLICKCAPFIWGMQRALKAAIKGRDDKWAQLTPIQRMYEHIPDKQEFVENGGVCEDRFPQCEVKLWEGQ